MEYFIYIGSALTIAFLKDIFDWFTFWAPPVEIIVTLMATTCIGAALYLAGSRKQKDSRLFFQKAMAYVGGTGAEFVIGLDFLPMETLMVVYLYTLLLRERSYAKQEELNMAYATSG